MRMAVAQLWFEGKHAGRLGSTSAALEMLVRQEKVHQTPAHQLCSAVQGQQGWEERVGRTIPFCGKGSVDVDGYIKTNICRQLCISLVSKYKQMPKQRASSS